MTVHDEMTGYHYIIGTSSLFIRNRFSIHTQRFLHPITGLTEMVDLCQPQSICGTVGYILELPWSRSISSFAGFEKVVSLHFAQFYFCISIAGFEAHRMLFIILCSNTSPSVVSHHFNFFTKLEMEQSSFGTTNCD